MRIDATTPATRPTAPRAVASASAGAPAQPAPAPAPGLVERLGKVARSVGMFARHVFVPFGTWHNPQAEAPQDTGGLKVMTYNVMVKTTNFDAVARDLEKHQPDVVGLQETSEATARQLAEKLGMHLAWQEDAFHAYGGTAVLSRYPIQSAEKLDLDSPFADRAKEFWTRLKGGKPRMAAMDKRFGVLASVKVGDRTVDVLTAHLTLFGAGINAGQIEQLGALAKQREAMGHSVVLTGDWNANMMMAGDHPADAKGVNDTPTDTNAEARDRMPHLGVGNQGHAAVEAAMDRLAGTMNTFWDAPSRSVLVDGTLMSPETALAELKAGKAAPNSERYRQLRDIADGSTLLGGDRRFDNIFASKDVRIESALIDQTTRASDHQPAMAEIRWD